METELTPAAESVRNVTSGQRRPVARTIREYHAALTAAMPALLKIDQALKRRIQRLAEPRGQSPHRIVLDATPQDIERKEGRERFTQEALASRTAYRETSNHLSGAEVRVWLKTWGTDDERAMPACHR